MWTSAVSKTFVALGVVALVPIACATTGPDGEPLVVDRGGDQNTGGDPIDPVGSGGAGNAPNNDGGDAPQECPSTDPPPIDPASLPECPSCAVGGAHCVPTVLVPAEQQAQLASCDAESLCVPDMFIETEGRFIAESCESVAGAEGRCLSPCIPEIAEQAANLPQSTCGPTDVCVPCFDPQTGTSTGACELSCDPGPAEPPTLLPPCCEGRGTCVPKSAAGDQADRLGPDSCPQDASQLVCAPNEYVMDPAYQPPDCNDFFRAFFFGEEFGPGKCMSECIPEVADAPLTGAGDCEGENVKCVPCLNPLSGEPTGVCEP
jgi:hypothetical protein